MSESPVHYFTSYWWALVTLLASGILFDLVLVRFRPIGIISWKRVDYIWLALALLGILGGVGNARQNVANQLLGPAREATKREADEVKTHVSWGTSAAVCRPFVRSEFSPPEPEFGNMQKAFDDLCAWFRGALARLDSTPIDGSRFLTLELLGAGVAPPPAVDTWIVESLSEQIADYNAALLTSRHLADETQRAPFEETLIVLGPFLLAVGLALRVTKVTGEIRLSRRTFNHGPG